MSSENHGTEFASTLESSPEQKPINTEKLAQELWARPQDFTREKRRLRRMLQELDKVVYIDTSTPNEPVLRISNTEKGGTLLTDFFNRTNRIFSLPLFANVWDLSEKSLTIFRRVFAKYAYERIVADKSAILNTILYSRRSWSPQSHVKTLWKHDLDWILVMFIDPPIITWDLEKKMQVLQNMESRYTLLRKKNISQYVGAEKIFWEQRHPVTALFVDNERAREKPETDIPYLDEFLCYHESIYFRGLLENGPLKNIPLMTAWLSAKKALLADTESETYKMFCHIFQIDWLYDSKNTIAPATLEAIRQKYMSVLKGLLKKDEEKTKEYIETIIQQYSPILEEVANIRQQQLAEKTALQVSETARRKQAQLVETARQEQAQHVANILAWVVSLSAELNAETLNINIRTPEGVTECWVDIVNDRKRVQARAKVSPWAIDLRTCQFEVFPQGSGGAVSWDDLQSQLKPGSYTLTLIGRVNGKSTPPQELSTWKKEKPQKETPPSPVTTRENPIEPPKKPQNTPTRDSPPSQISTPPSISEVSHPVPTASPSSERTSAEQDQEDFETALEMVNEGRELQDLCTPVLSEDGCFVTVDITPALWEAGYGWKKNLQWTFMVKEPTQWHTPEWVYRKVWVFLDNYHEQERQRTHRERLAKLWLSQPRTWSNQLAKILEEITINMGVIEKAIWENDISVDGIEFRIWNGVILLREKDKKQEEIWCVRYFIWSKTFSFVGIPEEYRYLYQDAVTWFLIRAHEDIDDISTLDETTRTTYREKLVEKFWQDSAKILVKQQGREWIVSGLWVSNLTNTIAQLRERHPHCRISTVYRIPSFAFHDSQISWSEAVYIRCLESDHHVQAIQARCRATLIGVTKAKNSTGEQEYATFTNGVADKCREFFAENKSAENLDDIRDFIVWLEEQKVGIVYSGGITWPLGDLEGLLETD